MHWAANWIIRVPIACFAGAVPFCTENGKYLMPAFFAVTQCRVIELTRCGMRALGGAVKPPQCHHN